MRSETQVSNPQAPPGVFGAELNQQKQKTSWRVGEGEDLEGKQRMGLTCQRPVKRKREGRGKGMQGGQRGCFFLGDFDHGNLRFPPLASSRQGHTLGYTLESPQELFTVPMPSPRPRPIRPWTLVFLKVLGVRQGERRGNTSLKMSSL